jgi:hypothetical protein
MLASHYHHEGSIKAQKRSISGQRLRNPDIGKNIVSLQIIVAIAWTYIVVLMAVAEATGANGSILGAMITFVLYGVLPLAIVLYILGAKARRTSQLAQPARKTNIEAQSVQPDAAGHAPSDTVTAVGKEM